MTNRAQLSAGKFQGNAAGYVKSLMVATVLAFGLTAAIVSVAHADPRWSGTYFDQLSQTVE